MGGSLLNGGITQGRNWTILESLSWIFGPFAAPLSTRSSGLTSQSGMRARLPMRRCFLQVLLQASGAALPNTQLLFSSNHKLDSSNWAFFREVFRDSKNPPRDRERRQTQTATSFLVLILPRSGPYTPTPSVTRDSIFVAAFSFSYDPCTAASVTNTGCRLRRGRCAAASFPAWQRATDCCALFERPSAFFSWTGFAFSLRLEADSELHRPGFPDRTVVREEGIFAANGKGEEKRKQSSHEETGSFYRAWLCALGSFLRKGEGSTCWLKGFTSVNSHC
ncbi:UNVERIFIED_CONTAM: hypothetical protein HHA_452980 [Hammondia hammondi]|eukprot:XP_008886205.1 hypothetical protein HHA_452980 [Hammondia hammondi]